jgi:hypothetical protein
MPGVRDLEALIRRYGGVYVRTSSSGHKRWKLGKRMITVPNAHSLSGGKRTYDNVEAYIHRVARDERLKLGHE